MKTLQHLQGILYKHMVSSTDRPFHGHQVKEASTAHLTRTSRQVSCSFEKCSITTCNCRIAERMVTLKAAEPAYNSLQRSVVPVHLVTSSEFLTFFKRLLQIQGCFAHSDA
jgi:hypothetical protein